MCGRFYVPEDEQNELLAKLQHLNSTVFQLVHMIPMLLRLQVEISSVFGLLDKAFHLLC